MKEVFGFFALFLLIFAKSTANVIPAASENNILNNENKQGTQNLTFANYMMLAENNFYTSTSKKRNTMEETIRFLDEAQKALNLSESQDLIITVGNTGSGKTTFSHFIAGDNDKLISVKTDDDPYSSDYIIEDTLNRISKGNETTISKTIVPELIVDSNGIVWYDCPGFSDTRNTTVEIGTTYLIKSLIDHAKTIKIVFVVNHASVTSGLDRSDFDRLVRHADQLITKIDRYKLSIALVVSKVEAYPPRSNKPLPSSVIAQRVATYIQRYRDGLIDDAGDDIPLRAIQLLGSWLHKDEQGNYNRIGVFFRPDAPGPLSKIPLLQKAREEIRNIIINNLKYADVQDGDFGYTLSAKAQIDIGDLSRLVSQNITTSVGNIGEQIIASYKQKETTVSNLTAAKDLFVEAEKAMSAFRDNAKHLTAKALLTRLNNFIRTQQILIPKNDIENIYNQQKYLEFLERVSLNPLPVSTNDWLVGFDKTFNYILNEQNWYIVLVELYNILSEYNIQKDLQLYDVADVSKWGKGGGRRGIFINHYNIHDFLKLHKNFYDLLKNMEIDDNKLNVINDVLNTTLKHEIEYRCMDEILVARREFLKMSDINLKQCGSNIKQLELYAIETFFVDADLDFRGQGKKVAIIANKLSVPTKAVFSLQGNDSTYVPPTQPEPSKTRLAGTAGEPGKPGTNGVNLVLLFNEIYNGAGLTVNAYGGSGSDGQDGGKAYPRKPEKNFIGAYYDSDEFGQEYFSKLKANKIVEDYKYNPKEKTIEGLRELCNAEDRLLIVQVYYDVYTKCCAADGLAGAGGIGGYGGQTKVISLTERPGAVPAIINYNGTNGRNGRNVDPCVSEKAELRFKQFCTDKKSNPGFIEFANCEEVKFVPDERCKRENYTEFNTKNLERPPAQQLYPYESIIGYKSFLREKLKSGIRTYDLFTLYQKIEENSDVQNSYRVIAFAKELQSYEDHFYELNSKIDFIPFYESFLKRVESYSQLNTTDATSYESKKVLAWLYTSALSKIQGLNTNRYSSLVIDIATNFETSIQNIKELTDANKEQIINKQKNEYKKELDAKIDEATYFIDKVLTADIDQAFKSFDEIIDDLLDDTIAKKHSAESHIKELEQNKIELERNMKLRLLVGVFKGIGQITSFMGPIGAAAGSAIQTASDIGGSFVVDSGTPRKRFTMPSGIKDTIDKVAETIKARKQSKIDALDKQIDKLTEVVEGPDAPPSTVIGNDYKKAIRNIKEALEKEKKSASPNKETIDELNKRFLELVKERKAYMEKNPSKVTKRVLKAFEYAGKALEVISSSVDLYNAYKDDEEKLNEIVDSIEAAKDDLLAIEGYEQQIYDTLLPSIHAAQEDFMRLEKDFEGRSQVALDVQKWNVQSKLRTMKQDLVSFTKGFSAEEQIARCVDRINEAILTMIGLYDRIQGYQDQERLAVYIAALHSAAYEKIEISDEQLKAVITKLRITIQSNIILAQYLNAANNFKQAVFPFAPTYLDDYSLPSHLVLDNNLKDLVDTATQQIQTLSIKIKDLNASIVNKDDAIINTGYFNGDNEALDPFYVWKYNEFKQDISDLLSGKQVYLKADVTRSFKWNAVKFSEIGVEFKLTNTSDRHLQNDLKAALNRFHINMTHLGNSYYRCNNQFYVSTSPSQVISFSYEKTGNEPTFKNAVYEKLKRGNFILSPFTLWSIQLERGDFKTLEKYRNSVDIELRGYGQCVNEGASICNRNLEKYYRWDKSLSEVNNIDVKSLIESPSGDANYLELGYLL